jgi:protoheme IX farnesyltransferase
MLTFSTSNNLSVVQKLKVYVQILKLRLSLLVAFSGAMAFILASYNVNMLKLSVLILGGIAITGAANIINQIKEVEFDRLMKRTKDRPLPMGFMSIKESAVYSVLLIVFGFALHYLFLNPLTAYLSLASLVLYGFAYTPLKRVGPIAVFVGAIPGALPPLIGWVACTGEIVGYNSLTGTLEFTGLILFGIQFIWQFPHFWAIAWVGDEDYRNAGFRLLPNRGEKNITTAFNIMTYALFLIPLSLLPHYFGVTGKTSAIVVTLAGLVFLYQTIILMKTCDQSAAKKMMFGSFIYLPIVQVAYVLDKI